MSENQNQSPRDESRRKLFKVLMAGGAAVTTAKLLPEKWVKPVVDAVILPAHAQGSLPLVSGLYSTDRDDGAFNMPTSSELADRIVGFFIRPAYAPPSTNCSNYFGLSANVSFFIPTGNGPRNVSVALSYNQNCTTASTFINETNGLGDISIGEFNFTNLSASPAAITGTVSSNLCSTSAISIPFGGNQVCQPG